jgi:hypothetical protein
MKTTKLWYLRYLLILNARRAAIVFPTAAICEMNSSGILGGDLKMLHHRSNVVAARIANRQVCISIYRANKRFKNRMIILCIFSTVIMHFRISCWYSSI